MPEDINIKHSDEGRWQEPVFDIGTELTYGIARGTVEGGKKHDLIVTIAAFGR